MKKIIWVFLALSVALSVWANDEDGDKKTNQPSYGELAILEKSAVKTYDAYKFKIVWADGKPQIIINQEQVEKPRTIRTYRTVAVVNPELSLLAEVKLKAKLLFLSSVKPASTTIGEQSSDGDLVKYNIFDDGGKLRAAEWRNRNNGFSVEFLTYDKSGKPLTLTYYYKLKVNKGFSKPFTGSAFLDSLDNAVQKIGRFDLDDLESTIRFSKKLLNQVVGDRDDDDDDKSNHNN